MALIFCDDFETGGFYHWTIGDANITTTGANVYQGARAADVGGAALYARKTLAASYSELFVSMFILISGTQAVERTIFKWLKDGTELGSLRWDWTSKNFRLYTGTATLVGTGTVVQNHQQGGGAYCNLNLRILIHASTGVLELRHDGNTPGDIVASGINTVVSGNTNINQIQLGPGTSLNTIYVDNFWLNDTSGSYNNSWPGVKLCLSQYPTGKSATNDAWTADSGTNKWDRIDEAAASSADYVYSPTVGLKQGFTFAASTLPSNASVAAAVQSDIARKISSGSIKQGTRRSGVDYPSSTKGLLTSYATYGCGVQHIMEVDPATSNPWAYNDNLETYLEHV